jgi:excisionase family DNA binding protein
LPSPSSDVATVHQAAARLGISKNSVIKLLRDGRLRRLAGLRKILIPTTSIDSYLAGEAEDTA